MVKYVKRITPLFLVLLALFLVEGGISTHYAEARSMKGGRSFRSTSKSSPAKSFSNKSRNQSSFSRGLMGGLLGGALGGLLFGSMFGAGGSGMGILPILILAGVAYFMFRRFNQKSGGRAGYGSGGAGPAPSFRSANQSGMESDMRPPPSQTFAHDPLEEGIAQIRATDKSFDKEYFVQVASDVFFQIQAGWMRRDVDSYRHLLGNQLADEYRAHFAKMKAEGRTNKLESIAVRSIEVVAAGSDGLEDFVTVRFIASLLDYTEDDATGKIVEGSNTTPVKFEEQWTWARPVRTNEWKLEGIE